MSISHGLNSDHWLHFKKTSKVQITPGDQHPSFTGYIQFGSLVVYGLQDDCTSIHINNACNLVYADRIQVPRDKAVQELEEIKRYMWYTGKNHAFLTFAIYKPENDPHQLYLHKDQAKKFLSELGIEIVSEVQGSRESRKEKLVGVMYIEPRKIGYLFQEYTDFTIDPWYKARPENQPKPVVEEKKPTCKKKVKASHGQRSGSKSDGTSSS
jgi:hypothetical protein